MDALVLASCSTPRYFTPTHEFQDIYIYIYVLSFFRLVSLSYSRFVVFVCKLVGEAMSAIADNTNVPVTVKCRIGVDDHDSYDELCEFFLFVTNAFWSIVWACVWMN